MASETDLQLPAVLADLRDASKWLDPTAQLQRVVFLVAEALRLTAYAPTGDPQWLRSTAATFYAVGTDAIDRTTTLRTFSDQAVVPDTWDGLAATTAKAAAGALTGQAGTVQPAMDAAAAALTYLADELEGAQADHLAATALVQQGADKVNDADIEVWGVELPVPNPTKIYDGITDAVDGIEAAVAAHNRAEKAASLTVRRLGDATADARVAAAGRDGRLDPLDAVVLAHATTGPPAGPRDVASDILTPDQLDRATAALAAMTPADREAFTGLLAAAGSDDERAWLFKALAAGHTPAALTPFAQAIRDRGDTWLETHLALVRPLDVHEPDGTYVYFGSGGRVEVDQTDQTTCGPTTLVVARAMLDPLYAFALTTGGKPDDPNSTSPAAFDQRLTDAERDAHDAVTYGHAFPGPVLPPSWPRQLGSPPWGLSNWLNDNVADATGRDYDWRLVDSTDQEAVTSAVDDVRRNADAGIPTVLMVGDSIPRHYVLVIGYHDGNYQIYNPSGFTGTVTEQALLDGGPDLATIASWPHVQGLVAPRR